MIIKFVKQMTKPSVKKIITVLAENTTNMLMELTPLANQNEIKVGLKLKNFYAQIIQKITH